MKVASKIIFLFNDPSGFASSIANALFPNPNSYLRRSEESFELPLERYGIKDHKASGNLVHFIDDKGNYRVTVLLLQSYEPPVLVCAVNEVLEQIVRETSSIMPSFVAPFIVTASKLKWEKTYLSRDSSKGAVHGMQIGPGTDITQAMAIKTQKLPSSVQIQHEPLACFLHLARVLKLPTFLLVGQRGLHLSGKASDEGLEILFEMGELLASSLCLSFMRDRIRHNPPVISKEKEEPWRALYG